MTDDDEIIRRRLLFDGDGTSEDRKINLVLKKFHKWCNLDPNTDEGQSAYNQVVGMLAQCEFSYSKSRCIREMTESECKNYEDLKTETTEEINKAKHELEKISEDFKKANNYRKNNLEYEAIAKNIKKHPDRKQTQKRLYKLHNDIYQYKDKLTKLEQKMEKRRKQVRIVMNSIHQLEQLVCGPSDSSESGDETVKQYVQTNVTQKNDWKDPKSPGKSPVRQLDKTSSPEKMT